MALVVKKKKNKNKNLPASAGDKTAPGSILGLWRSPGEGHGDPLVFFSWRILWTEEPDRLQFMGSQSVRHDWGNLAFTREHAHINLIFSFLIGKVKVVPSLPASHCGFEKMYNNHLVNNKLQNNICSLQMQILTTHKQVLTFLWSTQFHQPPPPPCLYTTTHTHKGIQMPFAHSILSIIALLNLVQLNVLAWRPIFMVWDKIHCLFLFTFQ